MNQDFQILEAVYKLQRKMNKREKDLWASLWQWVFFERKQLQASQLDKLERLVIRLDKRKCVN